jgi:hypothetical protein
VRHTLHIVYEEACFSKVMLILKTTIYNDSVQHFCFTIPVLQYARYTYSFTTKTEEVAEKGYFQLTISELWELSTSSADVDLEPSPLLCGFRLRIGVVGQPANICKIAHLTQNFVSILIIDI